MMPKGNSFERAFRLEELLKKGVSIREIMQEFSIKKPSALRMVDVMSTIKPVYEDEVPVKNGYKKIYRILK